MIAGKNSPLHSSNSPEWYTPADIADRAARVLDGIDLDPAAPAAGTPFLNIRAARYLSPAEDGLSHPWHGTVFLNPPYGRAIAAWMNKAATEIKSGRTTAAIILWRSSTDTAAWRTITAATLQTCFVNGRLHFSGHPSPAPFPSALFYYGSRPEAFREEFSPIGEVWMNPHPRRCPYEERETQEGFWTAIPSYSFRCTHPDRDAYPCHTTFCHCHERKEMIPNERR